MQNQKNENFNGKTNHEQKLLQKFNENTPVLSKTIHSLYASDFNKTTVQTSWNYINSKSNGRIKNQEVADNLAAVS